MKSSWGHGKAISYAPRLADLVVEYRKLNTREARIAFVDTWLKIWAYNFEKTWPVIYQVLEWVEQEKLYQDPRAIDPSEKYDDFKSYFEARLKKPFTMWFELEQTHHYVTKFAPDLVEKTFSEAQAARAQAMQQADAEDQAHRKPAGRPSNLVRQNNDVQDYRAPTGNKTAAMLRRLRTADRQEYPKVEAIYQRVLAGEISAHAGMIEAGFRTKAPSKKKSLVEKAKLLIDKMSEPERDEISAYIRQKSSH